MDELVTGGSGPDGWGVASPVYVGGGAYKNGGWVWQKDEKAYPDDVRALRDAVPGAAVDKPTMPGRLARSYSSFPYLYAGIPDPDGGEGSARYELQKIGGVGSGVQFAKTKIWYTDTMGDLIKGVPPNGGAYHQAYVGDGYYSAKSGPEPGSLSEQLLGDNGYAWSAVNAWYEIV